MYERVRERGFDSLPPSEARPTASLVALAEELGEDVAGVQVLSGLLARRRGASRSHALCAMCSSACCPRVSPEGWPAVLDDANRFKVAKALGRWSAYTPGTHEERVRQASAVLLATPPPPGWRPLGPDDELLRTLLPDEEA